MSFEEEIAKCGKLVYTNVGTSMLPLIKEHKDLLVIEPCNEYKKFDIVLHKSSNGKYVLHRILKLNGDEVVTAGDNSWKHDPKIAPTQILGKLTKIVRDGHELPLSGIKYNIYSHLRCGCPPVKFVCLGFRRLCKN